MTNQQTLKRGQQSPTNDQQTIPKQKVAKINKYYYCPVTYVVWVVSLTLTLILLVTIKWWTNER